MEYESTFGGITSLVAVMLLLTSAITALRITARQKQKIRYGSDDLFAVLAWVVFIGSDAVAIYNIKLHTMGYSTPADHPWLASIAAPSTQSYIGGLVCTVGTLGFARLSAVCFFRRIFCTGNQNTFDMATKIMIGIISLWTVGFFLSTMLACGSNFALYWSPHGITACAIYANQKGLATSSFLLDFIVLILPLPKVWSLHTTAARKIAISAVFLMALVGLAASCARMIMYYQIEDAGASANNQDPFEVNTKMYFYQLLEQGCCLIAVNLPSIWYFFHGQTPQKVLRGVRSLMSIRSTSSQEYVEKRSLETSQNRSVDSSSNEAIPSRRAYMEE